MGGAVSAQEQAKLTRKEYIDKYAPLAVEQQALYGIPASITLAQGLLESGNGNSRLAREGNNHFGIKCGGSWDGPSLRHDDDAPQECFRSYDSVEESYIDHSLFLSERERYKGLFTLDPKDYKGWAHGLKAAGYATNPVYAELLIKIIEEHQLYRYDNALLADYEAPAQPTTPAQGEVTEGEQSQEQPAEVEVVVAVDVDRVAVPLHRISGYGIYADEGGRYILAHKGDLIGRIGRVVGVSTRRLCKLNNIADRGVALAEGQQIYIE
ncbi:MAG: hypothetical protein E7134_03120 [Rikenellaceae bacterium]|nr:hypothetical protein [Rikenellaceae bacterium]